MQRPRLGGMGWPRDRCDPAGLCQARIRQPSRSLPGRRELISIQAAPYAREKRGPLHHRAIGGVHPLDRASVDTVVTTWSICTIPDVVVALSEMRRILKSNGYLLFVEHGLASDERMRRWQNRLTPVWKRIAGGCHLNRPITALIEDAGFRISQMETGYMPGPKPMTFMYEGSARLS